MFNNYVLLNGMAALPSAASPAPTPDNPANFLPSGPNFGFFSGMAPTVSLIISIALVVIFFVGLSLLITGVSKFRLKDPETGRGAKGLSFIITGIILMVAPFLTVPIVTLIINLGQSTAPQIH